MVLGTEASAGVAVEGFDRLNLAASPPLVSLELLSYENVGYRLDLQGSGGRVEVDLSPLGSKALFSLPSPALARGDEVTRLARAVVAGAETQYEASSRLLGWVSQNIRYHLDRSEAQAAPAVLRRRSAYCSGLARLSVALHRAVGLESREVPGLVLEASGAVKPHRWLEVRMADLGWVFSDPLSSHHFVPATYLPLASSRLPAELLSDGFFSVDRQEGIQETDLYEGAAEAVRARRNGEEQRHGTLTILAQNFTGEAILEGRGARRARPLVAGRATFLGLDLGDYRLRLSLEDGRQATAKVVFRERRHQWFGLAAVPENSGETKFGRTR